jgi:GDP-mannose pyrophosphatase NudK
MNTSIKNMQTVILSKNWGVLKKCTYDYQTSDGSWETQVREVYDRGDGATVLLFNSATKKVILTRQFRIPTYLNKNETGLLIETCAGKVDQEDPETCIRREIEEETGFRIQTISKVLEVYMSPGSVTELIHFYIAPYADHMKVSSGGGVISEQENIEVVELTFKEAMDKITSGEIKDGKTIILLQYAFIQGLI